MIHLLHARVRKLPDGRVEWLTACGGAYKHSNPAIVRGQYVSDKTLNVNALNPQEPPCRKCFPNGMQNDATQDGETVEEEVDDLGEVVVEGEDDVHDDTAPDGVDVLEGVSDENDVVETKQDTWHESQHGL